MRRLFEEHRIRKTVALDGIWNCRLLNPQNEAQKTIDTMIVPGCIENHPACMQYKGKALYSRAVWAEGTIRLWFGGVSHTARVFFDGKPVGEHYNAYTGFEILIPDVEAGLHLIEVESDNAFGENSALHFPNDYYTYGGIIRPVQMEFLQDVYICGMQIDTVKGENGWIAKARVRIKNLRSQESRVTLQAFLNAEKKIDSETLVLLPEEEREYSWECCCPDAEAWSPANPNLYFWEVRIQDEEGKGGDDLIDRIGFREIQLQKKRILVNGTPVKIKGVNRHEAYGDLGCCIPMDIMYRDIMLVKEMGANFVRTSHYQNDDRFLDLCDENGILVWEEGHARALDEEQMKNPHFMEQSKTGIREMIGQHGNHPSIIMWGILNECASHTAYGRTCYQELFELIKELDQTRPTTFASCHDQDDLCLDLPDILSFNIYPLWYTSESPQDYLKRVHAYVKAQGQEEKPLIISEIGAGGEYGFHSQIREKWSEERQADILESQLSAVLSDEECSGVCIWQFADCRVCEDWFAVRPGCRNNKGILDQYRRPKLAYYKVKEIF